MLMLGIESSCDDTSVALLDCTENGHTILAQKTASQIDVHKKFGGVVPEVAGRLHAEVIVPLIEEVLAGQERPNAIAVTAGPGLITGLIVGVEAARTLALVWNIPLVAVNHIEGHVHSVELGLQTTDYRLQSTNDQAVVRSPSTVVFPALCLVVSGGHTELILMKDHGDYTLLGKTKDDAAGECFDKVAKLLGLPYPGGPEISRLATTGRTDAIHFPRPMLKDDNYDFSFAGLKTSALYYLRDHPLAALAIGSTLPTGILGAPSNPVTVSDFCASLEQAIVDVLVAKTLRALLQYQPRTIILCGGVAANTKLRQTLAKAIAERCPSSEFLIPNSAYCMDNGAMIAAAGFWAARAQKFIPWNKIKADPNWRLA